MVRNAENELEGTSLARNEEPLEIDYSEVVGRTYKCIDGCALCCLCQPELLPDEELIFRKNPDLAGGIAARHISPDVEGAAIKLKGSHGSCYFLENKRCRIYSQRPHFCRSFPINVFVGWRVQVSVNLSCRGIGLEGESLEKSARDIISGYGDARLQQEVVTAKRVFSDFVRNCRESWVSQSFSSVRGAASSLLNDLIDEIGLSRVLTYAEHGRTKQNAPASDIAKLIRRTEADADVEGRALVDGTELFDLPDLTLLPIYIDHDLRWRIFRLVGNDIVGYDLDEDGTIRESSRTSPSDVELLPISAEGGEAIRDYLATVNRRDCFLGHAAYLCDVEGYEYNFAQVYLGALATNALDLWWRSSFLARLSGKEVLHKSEVKEGIVFFDMDLLDLPTIGAFI